MRITTCCFMFLTLSATTGTIGQSTYLDQIWNAEQQDEFCFTRQGAQLIPYKWFLALEQADSTTTVFRDNENMRGHEIATADPTTRNPNGLPIGLVRYGVDPDGIEFSRLSAGEKRGVVASPRNRHHLSKK